MRPPKRNRRPQLEAMESRAILSTSLTVASFAAPAVVSPPTARHEVVLLGPLRGSYSAHTVPDVGTTYDLSGQGRVQPLGQADVTGNLHSLGFILQGHAGGTLTLSDFQGTLTLKLTGPLQRGPSPLPDRFDYEITGGTGAFAHATGRGTVSLTFLPATAPDPSEDTDEGTGEVHRVVTDPIGGFPRSPAAPDPLEYQGRFDLLLVGSRSSQPPRSQT